jgi:Mrp family chromosome partitioning ATPase
VPVDPQTNAQRLAGRIHTVTSPLGIATTSLANISSLSAQDLVSSTSGMITVATQGVSSIDEVTTTWSVLENAQKPIVGVILTDSAS